MPQLFLVLLASLAIVAFPAVAADSVTTPASDDLTVIESIGRINGRALACHFPEIVNRAKSIVVARANKTRVLGDAFENAVNQAFLEQGRKEECPSRAALTIDLEMAARPLAPPLTHDLRQAAEAPETGINPRYLLQAMNGRAIMDGDFRQQFQFITFGYTFCPDVCPTSLLEIAAVLQQLGDQAGQVQALFFSVDPERDSLDQLRSYVGFFDKRIVAATGSPELVRRAAENFKVRYEKVVPASGNPAHYAIDHTAGMFLLAPGGQFIAKFPYGTPVAEMASRLRDEIAVRQKATQ
jgi:protein SCO1/2